MARVKFYNKETGKWEYADSAYGSGGTVTDEQIASAVEDYMAEHPIEVPDSSENVNGLDATSSALLITILRNGVYNADQSANITALAAELGVVESDGGDTPDEPDEPEVPEVTLSSISATYNGGDVTAGTAVTDLTGIVVTAHYSDGSSEAVTGYTLSGTIAEGSNTVTVTYQGKTATFTVTGVAESGGDEPGVGVNLLENVTYIEGVNYYSGGQFNADGYIGTDYIDVSSYEKLVLTTTSASWIDWKILWYTESKTFISESKPSTDGYLGTGYEESIELTIPENCKYIRSSNTETVMKALVVTAY